MQLGLPSNPFAAPHRQPPTLAAIAGSDAMLPAPAATRSEASTGGRRHDQPRPQTGRAPETEAEPAWQGFAERLERHLADCRRFGQVLSVLVFSVDDTRPMSVPAGDTGTAMASPAAEAVVLECGHRLRSRVRGSDVVVWLGGTCFGVVLVDCKPEGAQGARRRLITGIGGVYRLGEQLIDVTVDAGLACYPAAGHTGRQLIASAQADLKSAGR
jgi:diguanylate cyclase (GGDEF)-like protein